MNDRKKMISAPIIISLINIKIAIIIENNQQLPLPIFGKFQRFSTRSANVSKIWVVLFPSIAFLKCFHAKIPSVQVSCLENQCNRFKIGDLVAFSTTPPTHIVNVSLKNIKIIFACILVSN